MGLLMKGNLTYFLVQPRNSQPIESFRCEGQNEHECQIELKVFYACFQNKTPRKASFHSFSPKKLVRLFILKEVKPSPGSKMILVPATTTFSMKLVVE